MADEPPRAARADDGAAEEDDYFTLNPAPASTQALLALAREFIAEHATATPPRKVVLVTSGGTTVPLENQTVRFIDNFSAGTRGATSAEYFLSAGYAVIFLHRRFSLLPFSRHFSHSTDCFLDYVTEEADRVVVRAANQAKMRRVLRRYAAARAAHTLLLLPFTDIAEYLWALRGIAVALAPLGRRALFYLAAAVSDFFVPRARLAEHKIQSGAEFARDGDGHGEGAAGDAGDGEGAGRAAAAAAQMRDGSLVIALDPVPKFLKRLVDGWAPRGMIVSFKLETDPALLVRKARGALRKYAHHLVIGNLLATRKWEVVFVRADAGAGAETWIRVPVLKRSKSVSGIEGLVGRAAMGRDGDAGGGDEALEDEDDGGGEEEGEPVVEIERLIIPEVARMHDAFIARPLPS